MPKRVVVKRPPPPPPTPVNLYVSTTGSDSNDGSISAPFATLQKAHDVASPGTTIYLEDGTHLFSGVRQNGARFTKSGTQGNPITLTAKGPGRPVLDFSDLFDTTKVFGIRMDSCHWWHLKDFDITGTLQCAFDAFTAGINMQYCNDNIIERVNGYGHQGNAIWIKENSSRNLVLNCDLHDNYDPLTAARPGGNADGLRIANLPVSATGNVVRGCRFWNNSDDGIDLLNSEAPVTVEDCWSWHNGFEPGTENQTTPGVGYKLGFNYFGLAYHIVRRNLAWKNAYNGFDSHVQSGPMYIVHNTAWDNGTYNFNFRQSGNVPSAYYLRNNAAYDGDNLFGPGVDAVGNSWQLGSALTSGDFVSLDASGATGAREADGSLPTLTFLRPSSGSRLVNAGVILAGEEYLGTLPDIGAYERE